MSFSPSPPDSPICLHQDDSPLSTLSPQSSFETDVAQHVKYSWSGGDSTMNSSSIESKELGQEVTVVNGTAKVVHIEDVSRELLYGVTPKAGTGRKFDATPKLGTASWCEATPKAGTSSRFRATAKEKDSRLSQKASEEQNTNTVPASDSSKDGKCLSTPSWDIDKTFSFRKNQGEKQGSNHQHQQSQSSFSGIWDLMSTKGLSRSDSVAVNGEGGTIPGHLEESNENDLFALQVGLVYSADEGDTIHDPSTLYSQNFSASFTIESDGASANYSPAYDLAKYLSCRRQSGLEDNPSMHNYGDHTNGDESTVNTASQRTVRDDHGNKIPENAKMILGYGNLKCRKTPDKGALTIQADKAFPTVQNLGAAPEEMERRLRELAGQISADWRGSAFMPPALARRLRDFQFAREKRRKRYGKGKPWGILGLYDHLSGVKIDVEWAEDAAWRRQNKEPYLTWADYESQKNEGLNRPLFTFFIVSACTAMMFASILINDWKFEPLSVNPMIGPSAESLVRLGAKDSYLIVVQQEIWRLVSPMVLHAGLIHFFLNMFALWFVGKAIEQIHGYFPAVVTFVVPAIGGTILSAIFLPQYITVGASGGIFGLIGACISDIIMNWNLLFNEFVNERGARLSHARALIVLFLDIVLNCIIGLTPFVDNFTHLGGMVYGILCGLSTIQLVSPRFFGDERQCFHKCKLFFFRSFGLLVCIAGIIASSIVLFGDVGASPCSSCRYLSCVPFPPWAEKSKKWWYCDDCSRASAEGTLDTATGKFIELNIECPNESTQTVGIDKSWPQDEIGLEEMLPTLCRQHCLWE